MQSFYNSTLSTDRPVSMKTREQQRRRLTICLRESRLNGVQRKPRVVFSYGNFFRDTPRIASG